MFEVSAFSTITTEHLIGLAVSICIGFLIGLEREFSKEENEKKFAGVRTFTLISLFGFLSAFLSEQLGTWIFAVFFAGLITLIAISYIIITRASTHQGGTSEIASIITFLLGAVVFLNHILLALIVTVIVLLLLAFKPTLHLFVKKLTREELLAIIQFTIIAAVVLPFLPDRNFGPLEAWNLKDIWKMIILISGISLVGYLLTKASGSKGTLLAGALGGLASSTTATLSFSKRSITDSSEQSAVIYSVSILSACTIMFLRIAAIVYVVNKEMFDLLIVPISIVSIAGFVTAYMLYKFKKPEKEKAVPLISNPLNFRIALQFAVIYSLVKWLILFTRIKFGESGMYGASFISGLVDVDAITLSLAKLEGTVTNSIAATGILIAATSNTLMKLSIILITGSQALKKLSLIVFGIMLAVLTACIFFIV